MEKQVSKGSTQEFEIAILAEDQPWKIVLARTGSCSSGWSDLALAQIDLQTDIPERRLKEGQIALNGSGRAGDGSVVEVESCPICFPWELALHCVQRGADALVNAESESSRPSRIALVDSTLGAKFAVAQQEH